MIDFERHLGVTHRVLDAAAVRTKVILHNIANQDTPGFKRYTVSFEDRLREAHADGSDQAAVHPLVQRDTSGVPGENNVSLVEELALLEKVKMVHDIFSRRAGSLFARLNRAISGRS
jgi:flagellar basal body rod protein FlgB